MSDRARTTQEQTGHGIRHDEAHRLSAPGAYRRLLGALPGTFRERWGDDMAEAFADRLRRAGRSPLRRGWVWCRGVADVIVHALMERLRGRGERSARPQGARGSGDGEPGSPRGASRVDGLFHDLRSALQALRSAPGFAAAAVVTLALGIGASTATFSVVHAVWLAGLPYAQPDDLVLVWPEENANKALTLLAAETIPAFEGVSGVSGWSLTLVGEGAPLQIAGTKVSPHHFELLGVAPALGRTFAADEDLPGNAGVVILSHAFWASVFGSDPGVVGHAVEISGAEYDRRTVIGVMPPSFRPLVRDTDVWIPLEGDPALSVAEDDSWYVNYRVARLAPGASLEEVSEQVRAYAAEAQRLVPSIFAEEDARAATVQPLRDFLAGDVGDTVWVALGAVCLVLLIACANVANLMLARGEARAHDLAVRAALGAGRGRVARMLLVESGLLGVIGGGLGVLLAHGLVRLLVARAPESFPRIDEVAVNVPVLGWALVATLVATLLSGLVPALRASRADATASLGGAGRGAGGRSRARLSHLLVGAEVALAVVVIVGSGLMLRSLDALLSEDPGIDGEGVLVFQPSPPGGRYPDGAAFRDYYARVIEQVKAVPGVESAGAIHLLPGTMNNWSFPTHPEGAGAPEGAPVPGVNFRAVRPGYFETVRVPLLAGRLLEPADRLDSEAVVLVNRAFVERFWPGEDPLGKEVRIFARDSEPYRVVGVVGDVRQHRRDREPLPEMYLPHDQVPWNQMSLWIVARFASGDPLERTALVRQAVWSVDPDVPISGMDELSAVLASSTRTAGFLALLLSAFGALALVLGGIGVFGVTAYTVGRRIPEFGVRIALGSSRRGVVRSAVRRSLVPVGVGLAAGLVAALATAGFLESVLYEVTPTDPATFAGVGLVLAAVAAGAAVLPAWRASGVDPVTVLDR